MAGNQSFSKNVPFSTTEGSIPAVLKPRGRLCTSNSSRIDSPGASGCSSA